MWLRCPHLRLLHQHLQHSSRTRSSPATVIRLRSVVLDLALHHFHMNGGGTALQSVPVRVIASPVLILRPPGITRLLLPTILVLLRAAWHASLLSLFRSRTAWLCT